MNKHFSGASATARWLAIVSSVLATACSDANDPGSRTVASLKIGTGDKQVASAGSALTSPVTFTAVDDKGRAVSGVIVAFTVSAGGGSVAADRDTSDRSGNVTAQWTVGTTAAQAQSLTATVVSSSSIAPVQASASVVAGPASALAGGTSSVAGRIGAPINAVPVSVRDKYGNAVAASNVRITVRLENAAATTLAGTTESRTDGSGNAAFTNLSTTGKSGATTLLFESDGLSPARVSLVLAGGQPAKVATVGSATLDAEALLGGPPISAKVFDAFDNAVAGAEVAFAIDGNAIGSATTGNDGVATLSSWTVPQIGAYKLTASAAGASTGAQFTLNARAVGAKTLVPLTTNPTTGGVGNAIVVGVTALDAIGRVVPNAPLIWTLNGLDQDVTADGNGIARFTVSLPTKAGKNQIGVRASSSVSTTINVEGLPGAFALSVADKDSIDVAAGSTVNVTFTLQDAFGNPIPNFSVPGYISTAFGPLETVSATSDASGKVTLTRAIDPYAGQIDFAVMASKQFMHVYASAERGSVRIANSSCTKSLNTGTTKSVDGYVFGPNGRLASGVAVAWTPATGSGSVYSAFGPSTPQSSVTVSSQNGLSPIVWLMPAALGTYSVTAQGPSGYDLPASVTLSCTVIP